MSRGLIIALALSLAANVFLGGFIAGKILSGPGHGGRHMSEKWRDGRGGFEDLTPAARDALRRAFREHRAEAAENRRDVGELHGRLIALLKADTFDRPAGEAIADEFEAADSTFRGGMARIMIEAADGLSAEDRRSLAKHLERRSMWDGRHGGPRGGGPPGAGPPGPPPDGDEPPVE